MNIRKIAREEFLKTLLTAPVPTELKQSARGHERSTLFINNISKQLILAQVYQEQKTKKPFKESTIRESVKDMTMLFLQSIMKEVKIRDESDIARVQRRQESDYQKDLSNAVDGNLTGEFEELKDDRIIIKDTVGKQI
jgi:hypothetical protein